jgi:SAM-dependent methyltransferase
MHVNAELLFIRYGVGAIDADARVLEVGPASRPSRFEELVHPHRRWESADIAAESMGGAPIDHVMADEYTIPVSDEAFDVVLSAQVIEHVRKPWVWMRELARVCRAGGQIITIGPVSWPYHEAPIDCWRAYPEGMRALCEDAGLTVELSVFETLEEPRSRRPYPGTGLEVAHPTLRLKDRIATLIGWPRPVSFDTITIARK